VGFSGGEKKRNEILQMAVLQPMLAILDETDSGLDIDALRIVANGVNALKRPDNAAIVVTHYQRLLNYIVPDYVHVLAGGRIVKSGDLGESLYEELFLYEELHRVVRAIFAQYAARRVDEDRWTQEGNSIRSWLGETFARVFAFDPTTGQGRLFGGEA
jgi:ABC-type multidrug transport system ATPase subunit